MAGHSTVTIENVADRKQPPRASRSRDSPRPFPPRSSNPTSHRAPFTDVAAASPDSSPWQPSRLTGPVVRARFRPTGWSRRVCRGTASRTWFRLRRRDALATQRQIFCAYRKGAQRHLVVKHQRPQPGSVDSGGSRGEPAREGWGHPVARHDRGEPLDQTVEVSAHQRTAPADRRADPRSLATPTSASRAPRAERRSPRPIRDRHYVS